MNTSNLDYYLINTPERIISPTLSIDKIWNLLLPAFKCLDKKVSEGLIGGYGVCSTTLTLKSIYENMQYRISLENFKCYQGPGNIYEIPHERVDTNGKNGGASDVFIIANRPLIGMTKTGIKFLKSTFKVGDKSDLIRDLSVKMDALSVVEDTFIEKCDIKQSQSFIWSTVFIEFDLLIWIGTF